MAESLFEQDLINIKNQIGWLEEERRKSIRRIAELEQKVNSQESAIESKDVRIKQLESDLQQASPSLARAGNIETRLADFREDIIQVIQSYDSKRGEELDNIERLYKVTDENRNRQVDEIQTLMPQLGNFQQVLSEYKLEQSRTVNLIAETQQRINIIEGDGGGLRSEIAYLQETLKRMARESGESQALLSEANQRMMRTNERVDITADSLAKAETTINELRNSANQRNEDWKSWMDQLRTNEFERDRKLKQFDAVMQEHAMSMERYSTDWGKFEGQFMTARVAMDTLSEWQRQMEQRQQELAEVTRLEAQRMVSSVDKTLVENDKNWRNFKMEAEQQTQSLSRRQRGIEEELAVITERLELVTHNAETLLRITTAQSDALKMFPRIWMEQVEKAVSLDPNRRRQNDPIPLSDELYGWVNQAEE